jgi:hypothetical protein
MDAVERYPEVSKKKKNCNTWNIIPPPGWITVRRPDKIPFGAMVYDQLLSIWYLLTFAKTLFIFFVSGQILWSISLWQYLPHQYTVD